MRAQIQVQTLSVFSSSKPKHFCFHVRSSRTDKHYAVESSMSTFFLFPLHCTRKKPTLLNTQQTFFSENCSRTAPKSPPSSRKTYFLTFLHTPLFSYTLFMKRKYSQYSADKNPDVFLFHVRSGQERLSVCRLFRRHFPSGNRLSV